LRYEPQWSWREHWYAGGQYRFLRTKSSLRRNPQFDASVISLAELDLRTASLGPRVTRDSRNDPDYPREGSLFDLRIGLSGEAADGEFKYETYDIPNHKGKSRQPSFQLRLGQEQPRSLLLHRRGTLSFDVGI